MVSLVGKVVKDVPYIAKYKLASTCSHFLWTFFLHNIFTLLYWGIQISSILTVDSPFQKEQFRIQKLHS
jgi:hypothetical protein